jgi:GNAT superfamily N-acetyltransferase
MIMKPEPEALIAPVGPPPAEGVPRDHRIREIDPSSEDELALVTRRMRETLVHVLGEERGTALYTMEWLRDRLLWHMDPAKSTAQVFVAERGDGHIAGHTIVRVERDEIGREFGLFSTTFVEPESRQLGIATSLLRRGEAWMIAHGMTIAATDTALGNTKLIRLFEKHGYRIVETAEEMVRLSRMLTPAG